MNLKIFLFLGSIIYVSQVESTIVSNCTITNAPSALEVDIEGCEQSPCSFFIGNSGVMTMKFRAPRYLEHIKPNALATVLGANVTYPLNQNDACVGITNTPCPIAEGEYVEYTYSMFILPIFPAVNLKLEFSLLDADQNNEPFVCFKTDLQLVQP